MMPLALAVLVSFILSPIVRFFQRKGLGPRLSVALTMIVAFLLVGGTGMLILGEFRTLANELPEYQQKIRKRIADVHFVLKTGSLGKVQNTVKEVVNELKKEDPPVTKNASPVPVVLKETGGTFDLTILKPLFGPLVTTGLVIVLVIFMLLRREDLRDRVLQLAGRNRLVTTTKAIDEAGKQVSRYLLRQFLVNTCFGITVGAGFGLLGLPYALLWGFFAGVARFVPYVGVALGLAGPFLLGLAVLDGWTTLLLIVGVFIGLEVLTGMLIEPLIYGHGVGVSEVALLVMIAFWTWLWGGIGLVLATPLTVCLLVISKSVPDLKFIALFLSREPGLDVHQVFYHRLIAKDEAETQQIVTTFRQTRSQADLFEELFIPTLVACRRDTQQQKLTEADRHFIFAAVRKMIEGEKTFKLADVPKVGVLPGEQGTPPAPSSPWMLGYPAHDEADELVLLMLAELLRADHWRMRVIAPGLSPAAAVTEAASDQPAVICLGCLQPDSTATERDLFKELGSCIFRSPVIIGCWGGIDHEIAQRLLPGVATNIGWTLTETKKHLIQQSQATPDSPRPTTTGEVNGECPTAFKTDGITARKLPIKFVEQTI